MSYLFGREDGRDFEGKRHLNKGGGGGGSSGVYYANQDKLLGTQADIATNMYNVYADYAPGRLEAMDKMVNEAMDGTLADRARGQAAADAGSSLSGALAAADRNIQRYGTSLNANALSANLNDAALMGAANRTGAMNRSQQWAEGQKWARNSDMYGSLQGMPGTATQALGSAASGYGQMAGQQNQVNMANAMGYGQMGGMIGYGLMARDGGYIHEGQVIRRGDEPGFSFGGDVGGYMEQIQPGGFVGDLHNQIYAKAEQIRPGGFVGNIHDQLRPGGTMGEIYNRGMPGRKAWLQEHPEQANRFARGGYIEPGYAMGGMPKLADWRNQPTAVQNTDSDTPSAAGQVAMGMAPSLATMGIKKYAAPYIKDGIKGAWDSGMQAWNHAQNVAGMQEAAGAELAQIEAAKASTADAAGTGLTTGAADVTTGGAMASGAETAGATAATETAAATAGTEGLAGASLETGGAMAVDAAAAEAAAAAAAEAAAAEATAATAATAAEAAGTASTLGPAGWVAGAALGTYALGSAMDWWADGGPVPHNPPRGLRKNMIPGGPVNGPGTETSDSIPAWLSDGEYVINADAVKEHGKKKLEKINEKGLKKRRAKAKPVVKKAAGIKKPVKK